MNKTKHRLVLPVLLGMMICSCGASTSVTDNRTKHMAEIKHDNGSSLYLDVVDSRSVLSKEVVDPDSSFCCFKIGIADSVVYDKKKEEEWGKYFNYDMQYNWVALHHGDSIKPVFFQPVPNPNSKAREGVLVFEVSRAELPDTIIYRKPGNDGVQDLLLVLNKNK